MPFGRPKVKILNGRLDTSRTKTEVSRGRFRNARFHPPHEDAKRQSQESYTDLWTPQKRRRKCPEVGLGFLDFTLPTNRETSEPGILNRPLDTSAGDACEVTRNRFRATPTEPGPSRIGENRRRPSRSRYTFGDLHSRANHHKASQTSSFATQKPE